MSFSIGEDSEPYATYKVGADSVTKKLGSGEVIPITLYAYTTAAGDASGNTGTASMTIPSGYTQLRCPSASFGREWANVSVDGERVWGTTEWSVGNIAEKVIDISDKAGKTLTVNVWKRYTDSRDYTVYLT